MPAAATDETPCSDRDNESSNVEHLAADVNPRNAGMIKGIISIQSDARDEAGSSMQDNHQTLFSKCEDRDDGETGYVTTYPVENINHPTSTDRKRKRKCKIKCKTKKARASARLNAKTDDSQWMLSVGNTP